jgi:hypothetical protein
VCQQRKGANSVITAAAPGAEQRDLSRTRIERRKKGELGVGCVLFGWEARHGHTGRFEFNNVGCAERIKITDHLVEG